MTLTSMTKKKKKRLKDKIGRNSKEKLKRQIGREMPGIRKRTRNTVSNHQPRSLRIDAKKATAKLTSNLFEDSCRCIKFKTLVEAMDCC